MFCGTLIGAMKLRSSTKIGIGFVLAVTGLYYGYELITDRMIMNIKFPDIVPGRINLVGIKTSEGYSILVANQIAQLVQSQSGSFSATGIGETSQADDVERKRIPIRELLQTFQRNPDALGYLLMVMNDLKKVELPPVEVKWKAEDIEKALNGDKALENKLVSDLNMNLDGTPLPGFRIPAIENGIVIDSPVTVQVPVNGAFQPLVGRVKEPYKPRFIRRVEEKYAEKFNVTVEMIKGYYLTEARALEEGKGELENIRDNLKQRIRPQRLDGFAGPVEQVLKHASVVVNDDLIESADYATATDSDGKEFYTLNINLSDEGRKRLWQYSKGHVGAQLLLTMDGIAIAAPQIKHQIAGGRVTVQPLRDLGLVRDFVSACEAIAKRKQG